MDRQSGRERIFDWAWLLVWGVASSAWCMTAAHQLGATFDEPIYVARGLERWHTGSHYGLVRMGTMPLPLDIDTLPLYLWERWRGEEFDPVADLDILLPWARTGTLVFWWLLLLYGRLAGRQLAGPWGGRLAVALLACEPNLLAHASLATTDIAITASLLALVYHYRVGREAGWIWRIALPAVWFAVAVLSKASGLVFGPLCLLAVELERSLSRTPSAAAGPAGPSPWSVSPWWNPLALGTAWCRLWTTTRAMRRDTLWIGWSGLALAFLYCGCDWRAEPSFVSWAHGLPEGPGPRFMVWVAENLRIFSNAGEGLVRQVKHQMKGHDGTYLLGTTWPGGAVWYYFPLALTIKLSPFLLLLPVVLLVARPRTFRNWACMAAAILLVFSLTCRVQIGIRLMLPLVALAAVGLAGAVVRTCRPTRRTVPGATDRTSFAMQRLRCLLRGYRPYLVGGATCVGIAWMLRGTVAVWPHGLCYTNELWGGTANGYHCLSDSNYDWGQGLKELASWQERHPAVPLDVWYFGTDPLLRKLPMRELKLHVLPLKGPEEIRAQVRGHFLAVSTTLLYGMNCDTPEHWAAAAYLRTFQPVDRTTTFLIFDFTNDK